MNTSSCSSSCSCSWAVCSGSAELSTIVARVSTLQMQRFCLFLHCRSTKHAGLGPATRFATPQQVEVWMCEIAIIQLRCARLRADIMWSVLELGACNSGGGGYVMM
jgi:hypothetical protein